MDIEDILNHLKKNSNPDDIEAMARFGITAKKIFATKIPVLRNLAKKIGKNHELALKLWDLGYRETMILATMIDSPEDVSNKQMEEWVSSPYFSYWEIVDQTCMNLFYNTNLVEKKIYEWSGREEEFVKRAGFVLIAVLTWKDKNIENKNLEKYFPIIIRESYDERNNVKKAISWALRHIGKKNKDLNKKALLVAEEIQQFDSKAAKWIAKDVIRELKSEKIQRRFNEEI